MTDIIAGDSVKCVPSPRVTGADLPGELVGNILQFSLEPLGVEYRPYSFILSQFVHLALVCRDFANVCRPRLYRRLVLDSDKKLKRLTNLASSSSSFGWLLLLTKTLTIYIPLMRKDAFWVHRIFTVFIPRIVHAQCVHPFPDVEIATEEPIPGLIPYRASLPRPIPPSLLRHITTLEVQSFKFKRGDDLLWCLSSFGGLKEVKMTSCECEADATPAAVRRFLAKPGHLERLHCLGSRTCIPVGLLAIFCSEIRRADTTWCSPEKAEYQAIEDMVVSLANIGRPEPEDIKVINYNGHIEIETRADAIHRWPSFDYSFHIHLVPCREERYDCGIVLRMGPNIEEDTSSLLELWPKLANCMQNLRHVKQFSLKFEFPQDCWGWTADFMVYIRPFMQDLYAALLPGQCLVVDPPNPPRIKFENEEDYERYPYLGQSLYPEAVIAAMEEERKKWEEEKKKKEEQWKDMHERLERHIERREEQTEERGEKWEWERERDEEVWKKVDSEGKWMWMQEERAESGQLNEQPDSFDEDTLECGIADDF